MCIFCLRITNFVLRVSLLLSIWLGARTSLEAQRLIWLGTLGGDWSVALDVSADGSVVVGESLIANGQVRAFRWTASGGMQDLGTLGGWYSTAYGVSADGSVVVGKAQNATPVEHAFRWTASGGMQDLGTLGGNYSWAYGVSADGSVVVGWSYHPSGYSHAFRWTEGSGMEDLGTLGGVHSAAYSISADGSIIVGKARTANGEGHAFRWTNGAMEDLGTLPGGFEGWTNNISANGSVVVGWSGDANHNLRAFRWSNGVIQDLGAFPGDNLSWARDVSADGSIVVGTANHPRGRNHAFRWLVSIGMEDLNQTYANLITNGSVLSDAYAISPDGRFIVGSGVNAASGRTEAFLLDTHGEPNSVVDEYGPAGVILENVPNPVRTTSTIRFRLTSSANVRLVVYDMLGTCVSTLLDTWLPTGIHTAEFDGTYLPVGVYMYQILVGTHTEYRTLLLLK